VRRAPSVPFKGKWRIVQMDLWDKAHLDMLGPAYITFQTKGHGQFAFGCVQATMACNYATQTVFFTWEGCDEMDPVHGDGSAEITDDGFLEGEIAFHNGDESGFKAQRA
jgi:hypothetical protein